MTTSFFRSRLHGIKSRVFIACAGIMFVLSAGAAQASTMTDTAFVNRVYGDLLNRPADSISLSAGLNAIATNSVQPWLLGVLGSPEYRGDLVGAFYQTLLHRAPQPGEQTFYISLLGGTTDEKVEANIAGSLEYFANRGGSSNTGFLQAAFQDFLNRPPGPDLPTFLALLGSATREQVSNLILASSEYHKDLLDGYYERFLGRPVDTPGVAAFLPGMNNGTLTDEDVIAIILASPEYYQHAQPAVAAVPEPATWVMLISGFCGLGVLASRRRKYAALNAV